jgi:hypothetical protein
VAKPVKRRGWTTTEYRAERHGVELIVRWHPTLNMWCTTSLVRISDTFAAGPYIVAFEVSTDASRVLEAYADTIQHWPAVAGLLTWAACKKESADV